MASKCSCDLEGKGAHHEKLARPCDSLDGPGGKLGGTEATGKALAICHDPQFIPASSATFLHDPDRVIGVVSGQVAKAYPAAILSQRGLVEDQSPSGPIAITW